ncbi:hypothetical protein [Pseudomonas sp. LS-2]|uniref:hypothetical protein n=1 Tax=Pseudomonas sp. LS-2 TaxID=2315859 RepID=UPI000E71212C|nr:hypothetical protein [Pseudomonas sp. LS-2]RJX80332.1 hypothetical protein D3M70_12345 [Pseudomonas sp. LS-2]
MSDFSPAVDPRTVQLLALVVTTVFVYLAIKYSYRALMHLYFDLQPVGSEMLRRAIAQMPPHRSTLKAVAALIGAAISLWAWAHYLV